MADIARTERYPYIGMILYSPIEKQQFHILVVKEPVRCRIVEPTTRHEQGKRFVERKTSSENVSLACKRRIGNNNVPVFRFILIKILSGNDMGMFYLKSVFLQRQYKFTVRGIKRTPYHCIFRKIFDYRQYGILGSIIFIPTTFNT